MSSLVYLNLQRIFKRRISEGGDSDSELVSWKPAGAYYSLSQIKLQWVINVGKQHLLPCCHNMPASPVQIMVPIGAHAAVIQVSHLYVKLAQLQPLKLPMDETGFPHLICTLSVDIFFYSNSAQWLITYWLIINISINDFIEHSGVGLRETVT